jgi:hypothetical protein
MGHAGRQLSHRHILEHGMLLLHRAQLEVLDAETKTANERLRAANMAGDDAQIATLLALLDDLRKRRSSLH